MGLVGGPHCLAMCAAPCHAVIQGHGKAVQMHATLPQPAAWPVWSATQFHAGRLLGYGVLGAVAAFAMEQVAWFSDRTSMLHPVWVMIHLAILAWGKVQPVLAMRGGVVLAGMCWALMPCGLLYSAILVAALSASPLAGGLSMVAFGLGGALWLLAAPYAWRWLSGRVSRFRSAWGTRAAGGMLVLVSLWALWMDLIYKPSLWCR